MFRSRTSSIPILLSLIFFFLLGSGPPLNENGAKDPWKSLLRKHVTDNGFVDYEGIKNDSKLLDQALEKIREEKPGSRASKKKRIAYWIDAYNAFAIKLVIDHYPVKSIRNIDRAFERKFIEIEGRSYSLNEIEKGILLEDFDEPLIHYAVNCASLSCPPLRKEPYSSEELDQQLKDQAERFVNDPSKNRLKKDLVRISKLYDWYEEDFTSNGSLIDHLNRYAKNVTIQKDADIAYMEYDWGLNKKNR